MSEAVKIKLSKKDLESDQDVRWCPGCGDYAILATVQRTLANLAIKRENTVFISGIGCSSRFPYYMNTYGFHTIHGRAPAIASGLKITRPDLDVWVITGDGDGLSIGGNHMIHALRRNMDLKILLFNNQIYGLTKGQYSPTSVPGTRAPSTPTGSIDHPLNPISLALGVGATFIARAADTDAKGLAKILEEAYKHKGAVFIELLQNCPVFNDGIWEGLKDDPANKQLVLVEGKPLTFAGGTKGIKVGATLAPEIVDVGDAPGQTPVGELLVHTERGSQLYANLLAQLVMPDFPMPMGILYRTEKPTYGALAQQQIEDAKAKQGVGDLTKLLYSGMVWEVGADGMRH
ncbi:MAG: 2-oxoacid:ferredoxin oxidoreductase subunit beta [Deltaproteobacteria bacterium]|nr:2-oxoacid:ferredoxin oxidoreductase subunit beta [Deltaproteobacteria bacterium]MDQ3295485.1 2-oxoacid:ferredoxin oxidoreductase subunit beta [Myxococcota bacterium]